MNKQNVIRNYFDSESFQKINHRLKFQIRNKMLTTEDLLNIKCQVHNKPAFDISLQGKPSTSRFLCKLCKKEHNSNDQWPEIIANADFRAGSFLNKVEIESRKYRYTNIRRHKDQKSPQEIIEDFFGNLKAKVSSIIDDYQKAAIAELEILKLEQDKTVDEVQTDIELLIQKHQKIVNTNYLKDSTILNEFAADYSNLRKEYDKTEIQLRENLEKLADFLGQWDLEQKKFKDFIEQTRGMVRNLQNIKMVEVKEPQQKSKIIPEKSPKKEPSTSRSISPILKKPKPDDTKIKPELKSHPKLVRAFSPTTSDDLVQFSNLSVRSPSKSHDSDEDSKLLDRLIQAPQQDLFDKFFKDKSPKSPSQLGEKKKPEKKKVLIKTSESKKLQDPSKINEKFKLTFLNRIFTSHEDMFWGALCYVSHLKHLVSGGKEGRLKVWSVEDRSNLYTIELAGKIFKIIFVPSQKVLVVSSFAGKITLYNVDHGYVQVASYDQHFKDTYGLSYLPRHNLFASAGADGNIQLWEFNSQKGQTRQIRSLDTNKKSISSMCYIEDQDILAVGMLKGGHVSFFKPENTAQIKIVKAHDKECSVDCLVYVKEWNQLISGSEDGYIKFWDLKTINDIYAEVFCLKSIRRNNSYIESMVVLPEKKFLFHTNMDEYFSIWDLNNWEKVEDVIGHSKGKRGEAIIYLEDRQEIITGFTDEITMWKIEIFEKKE